MFSDVMHDERGRPHLVSTGSLPDGRVVAELLQEAHGLYAGNDDGELADYIPVLAAAPRDAFGLSVVSVTGARYHVGDAAHAFSIQSISKAFVFALVCDAIGADAVRERIGVNGTGFPFNSVIAVELQAERTTNPMVNSGAIATTSLVPGADDEAKWAFIRDGLSAFAGRELEVDEEVFASEMAANGRNQGIASLLASYDRLYDDPPATIERYTRQCSLSVTADDLATMGATLADGGVNPITGVRVVSEDTCKRTLAVMLTAGLYERSGEWAYEIGLPAKSGVSGGIVTISPGKGSLAAFSPPLDAAGNSVRGQQATKFLSDLLGLDIFASRAVG